MRLRLIPEARLELRQATSWYEDRQEGLGDRFHESVREAFATIRRQPQSFSPVTIRGLRREVRQYILDRFPYSVIYEIRSNEIVVLAIAHTRRRPNYWARRPPSP